jgi:hypothetical protein
MKKILTAIAIVAVGIQLVPVQRSNPPVTMDMNADPAAAAILRRACYDCHSNETTWPWYSYVAPVSWLVSDDVKEARSHLNFSEWDKYEEKRRRKIKEEIVEEVGEKRMPLKIYLSLHPEAKISDEDFQTIKAWAVTDDLTTEEPHESGDD